MLPKDWGSNRTCPAARVSAQAPDIPSLSWELLNFCTKSVGSQVTTGPTPTKVGRISRITIKNNIILVIGIWEHILKVMIYLLGPPNAHLGQPSPFRKILKLGLISIKQFSKKYIVVPKKFLFTSVRPNLLQSKIPFPFARNALNILFAWLKIPKVIAHIQNNKDYQTPCKLIYFLINNKYLHHNLVRDTFNPCLCKF